MPTMHEILVPLDRPVRGEAALDRARCLARPLDARLPLVYVNQEYSRVR